jgi:hypothetical protein
VARIRSHCRRTCLDLAGLCGVFVFNICFLLFVLFSLSIILLGWWLRLFPWSSQ